MADPDSGEAPALDGLQFDQAEYASQEHETPSGPVCTACKQPIATVYFEINGQIVCEDCRGKIESSLTGGSKTTRALRALAFGIAAGIAGFAIYFGVMKLANLEIGLISILVGFMVGSAVRKGSDHRGGWFYQLMAIFLTYTAVGASYSAAIVPQIIADLRQQHAQDAPKPEAPNANPDDDANARPSLLLALAVVGGLLLASVYALPIMVGLQQPIGLLIVAFALWEAWKLNVRPQLVFNGPFRVGDTGEPSAEIPSHA